MTAKHATWRRWLTVIAVTAGVLCVPLVAAWAYFALKPLPRPPSSFSTPIGALNTTRVPNGWAPYIQQASKESGVPAPVLAAQLETESNWQPDAVSPAGAQGLAQFMPDTWKTYGHGGDPFKPQDAISAQGRYMRDLVRRAENSGISKHPYELALAGYNAGFGNVLQFDDVPPYPETENYVVAIRDRTATYALPLPTPNASATPRRSPSPTRWTSPSVPVPTPTTTAALTR